MYRVSLFVLAAIAQATAAAAVSKPDSLGDRRLDQVQIIGTHNSYHQRPDGAVLAYLRTSDFADGPDWPGPRLARAIDYGHGPLEQQLDAGIRALELDIHDDPQGTLLAHPPFLDALAAAGKKPDRPWDVSAKMLQPGFKTVHKPAYDPRSSCPVFADCLSEIASWSKAHPDHFPIVLMIEVKADDPACAGLCDDGWKRLKKALSDAFDRSLLRPGDVGAQWPRLKNIRGRIMVMLLDQETHAHSYRAETDRDGNDIIFTAARPPKATPLRPDPHDRIAILPTPTDPRIADAQRLDMLVYTRADADTEEARSNDGRRRAGAFASGATFISTDYPDPDPRFSPYEVRFDGGTFIRCNPVTARQLCGEQLANAPASSVR